MNVINSDLIFTSFFWTKWSFFIILRVFELSSMSQDTHTLKYSYTNIYISIHIQSHTFGYAPVKPMRSSIKSAAINSMKMNCKGKTAEKCCLSHELNAPSWCDQLAFLHKFQLTKNASHLRGFFQIFQVFFFESVEL